MRFIITIIALTFLAGPAFATDYWLNPYRSGTVVNNAPSPTPGHNVAEYTPTTATGDTRSPTIEVSSCESIVIAVYGTTLTGTIQMCDGPYIFAQALNVLQCQDMTVTALNAANDTAVTMDDLPAFIRFGVVSNSDSSQHFQIVCNGSKK